MGWRGWDLGLQARLHGSHTHSTTGLLPSDPGTTHSEHGAATTDSSAAHYLPPRGSMTLWRRADVQRQKEGPHHKSLTCRGRCFFWGARTEEAASKHTQERRLLLAMVQQLPPHPATPRAFQEDSHLGDTVWSWALGTHSRACRPGPLA